MKASSLLTIATTTALITSASAIITMDYVTVGNPGNAADTTGYGAVAYNYEIGKYEVTNGQYSAFLNAKAVTDSHGLYNPNMFGYGIIQNGSNGSYTYSVTGGLENRPVVFVSWFDAARFTNWLANGQGNGDTETGSYTLLGQTSGIITVNTGAKAWIPTEDEWYKAAYYNPTSQTYSLYPNGQDSITTADANYGSYLPYITNVGTYSGAPSSYGTFDQGGNVWEWNDAVITGSKRGLRGGSRNTGETLLTSIFGISDLEPSDDGNGVIGFRVAVPEPSAIILATMASGMMLIRRKR